MTSRRRLFMLKHAVDVNSVEELERLRGLPRAERVKAFVASTSTPAEAEAYADRIDKLIERAKKNRASPKPNVGGGVPGSGGYDDIFRANAHAYAYRDAMRRSMRRNAAIVLSSAAITGLEGALARRAAAKFRAARIRRVGGLAGLAALGTGAYLAAPKFRASKQTNTK